MEYFIYKFVYGIPLRTIIGYMIILVISWKTFASHVQNKLNKKRSWELCNVLINIAAMGVILTATLAFRTGADSVLILEPFYSFMEARTQPELYRSMLMNVFLFFPVGLTLPFVLPENWKRKILTSILFAMAFSIGIEFTQYYFHLGRAETDDVICNTLGCAIGTLSYYLSEKFRKKENDETT